MLYFGSNHTGIYLSNTSQSYSPQFSDLISNLFAFSYSFFVTGVVSNWFRRSFRGYKSLLGIGERQKPGLLERYNHNNWRSTGSSSTASTQLVWYDAIKQCWPLIPRCHLGYQLHAACIIYINVFTHILTVFWCMNLSYMCHCVLKILMWLCCLCHKYVWLYRFSLGQLCLTKTQNNNIANI